MAVTSLDHRTALVMFGSETGNAQDLAEEIAKILERLRFTVHLSELDATSLVGMNPLPPVRPL